MEAKNLWERWDKEVEKFRYVGIEHHPSAEIMTDWRRRFLLIFMQELSKNLLHGTFDLLIEKIIEAIQVGCNFDCVRVYLVDEKNNDEIYLYKKSKGHDPIGKELRMEIKKGEGVAVETLFTGEPLFLDEAAEARLIFKEYLNLKGPYAAIPLLVEGVPVGLICANMSFAVKPGKDTLEYLKYSEFLEEVDAFVRSIMAAVENRKIFEQRNQKIKQLELIDKLAELIQSEKEKERLLNALVEYSVNLVDASGGHLKLRNEKTGEWEKVFAYGIDVQPPEVTDKPDDLGFYSLVLDDKKAVIINDFGEHPLMIKNKEFCIKQGYKEYLKRFENRKSALIVPLVKHNREVIGVLYVHSSQNNKFSVADKENLLALVNSVINAVDKTQQLEQQNEFLTMRDGLHAMFQDAVGKAYNLNLVLEIIRDSCRKVLNLRNIQTVCLSIKDPHSDVLTTPSVKCFRSKEKNCSLCFKEKKIIKKALKEKTKIEGKQDLALPILLEEEVIGVLYLQGENKIILNPNEQKILEIIISTAAILIKTARNYEEKINQSTAFYEAGQLSTKRWDFREWFSPLMERVMNVTGRKNRNFHLALIEEDNNTARLFIRETSPIFTEAGKIHVENKLLGLELPMDESLSGMVVKEKVSKYIPDVEENEKKSDCDPKKIKYHDDDTGIKSKIGIPLKIKEGDSEKVIGVLIINSIIPNDFQDFDWEFHESIANYLAIAIHNQQLYKERARFIEKLSRVDRSVSLNTIVRFFHHEFYKSIQNIKIRINEIEESQSIEDEDISYLNEQIDEQFSIFNRLQNAFIKPSRKQVRKQIKDLIEESISAIEVTVGLDINILGNYTKVDFVIECFLNDIELALRAIIGNAIKFSRQINKEKRYLKIDVYKNKNSDYINISFESSTVEQIPPGKQKLIFEPYYRGTEKEAGEGLGLAIAALCVKRHNGNIKVENCGDDAVKFILEIPETKKNNKEGELI